MKKVISFSLWGDSKTYTHGALKNVILAKIIYPEWTCRFYIPKENSIMTSDMNPLTHSKKSNERHITNVPQDIIDKLQKHGAEIIEINNDGCWYSTFWRYYAIEDSDIVIFRDCDSRLNYREKYAVDEWLSSDKKVHIMRDHPWHGVPILAGMWGLKKGVMDDMKTQIYSMFKMDSSDKNNIGYYQCDQDFLKVHYKYFLKYALIHSEFIQAETISKKFPTKRFKNQYVGQPYDEDNKALITIDKHMDKATITERFELDNKYSQ